MTPCSFMDLFNAQIAAFSSCGGAKRTELSQQEEQIPPPVDNRYQTRLFTVAASFRCEASKAAFIC